MADVCNMDNKNIQSKQPTVYPCTSIKQSEMLKAFLPIESADMYYHYNTSVVKNYYEDVSKWVQLDNHFVFFDNDIPCWSLAAMLNVLPEIQGGYPVISLYDNYIAYPHMSNLYTKADNLVDACVEMICKLHEQKLL